MIRRSFGFLAAGLLLPLIFFFAGAVRAETGARIGGADGSGSVDAGVGQKKVIGSGGKFEEYRDVKDGFLVNDASFRIENDKSRYFIDVKIKNPVQENESYSLTGGKHGLYKFDIFFDSIPHNFSNGVLLFNGAGTSRLTIADNVQSSLQAVEQTRGERGTVITDTTGEDALAQAIVRGLYAEAAPMTFRLKREKAGFGFEYNFTDDIKVFSKVTNEKRTGARVISAGSYERYAQGGSAHTADQFVVSGADLAEPIDYRTTTLSVGAGIYRKNWLADLVYGFTDFRNRNSSLVWDNPFRISDASSTNATDNNNSNAYGRGRFAKGQLSLVPDSRSHDITVSAGMDLPYHSKFAGSVSYGWVTQDDAFLPYTLNSAINTISAGNPGFDVTNAANLPQAGLNGKVKTLVQSYSLTSKPVQPLKVTLKYRYYDYKNESDEITFPGYAGFGESFWRTVRNDKNQPVTNEPLSYTRQTANLSVDYHAAKPLTLMLETGWEGWDREKLRIDSTTEYSVGGGFLYKAAKNASLKAGYQYAKRDVDGYKAGNTAANPEAVGLVNYDWAKRERNKANARFQYDPHESLSLAVSGQYLNDKFAEGGRFGLKKSENFTGGLDAAYNPSERLALFLNYTRENRKSNMNSGAKDDAFDLGSTADNEAVLFGNYNPVNDWNSEIREKTDTIGIGAAVQLVPGKLTLNANYNLSYSKMNFDTSNPNRDLAIANGYAQGAKLANGVAQPWPSVVNRTHEIKGNLAYNWFSNLTVGISYLFEWYKLNDFAWDNLNPYMAGLTAENSTRFVFADATYNRYETHTGQVYMVYKF